MSEIVGALDNVSKRYGARIGKRAKWAVSGVSIAFPAGRTYGLLGPNGAGKTTLLSMLVGLIRPTTGSVVLCGGNPRAPESRIRVGFLPEKAECDGFYTVEELLVQHDAMAGRGERGREQRIAVAMDSVGIRELRNCKVGQQSRGTIQRIAFAAAVLGEPDFLVLDEPMTGLDPVARHTALATIHERRDAGKTTIISTHVMSEIEATADHVMMMKNGRLLASAPIEAFSRGTGEVVVRYRAHEVCSASEQLLALGAREATWAGTDRDVGVVKCDEAIRGRVVARLVELGADVLSVEKERASLESAFLEIMRREAE